MKLIAKKKTIKLGTPAAFKEKADGPQPWKVLIVDDEEDIHTITRLAIRDFAFKGRQIEIINAMNGLEAREILTKQKDIALALVDVVMETDDAGLRLVEHIRKEQKNTLVRLVIRTGQPGSAPERYVIDHYDIDDYKDKTELTTQKLYTCIKNGVKSYHDLCVIELNRQGLEKILAATPNLYKVQPLEKLFEGILTQIIGLCAEGESVEGLLATQESESIIIRCKTDGISGVALHQPGDSATVQNCWEVVEGRKPVDSLPKGSMILPLKYENETIGFIYLERVLRLNEEGKRHIRIFANECALAIKNLRLYKDLEDARRISLYMLAKASEYHDECTGNHVNRIVAYTTDLAMEMGFSPDEADYMGVASMMHDVGKLGIPEKIISKPGPLTDEEFALMKTHPSLGTNLLDKGKWFEMACDISHCHHEKWDGSGYPRGIKGEEIPLAARIVAVADVFDALVSRRPYKTAWSLEKAVETIKNDAGTHFDPKVVNAFVALYEKGDLVRIKENFPED